MSVTAIETDSQFFADHPKRVTRIRPPGPRKSEDEFRSLGPHDRDRRRIIVVWVPDGPHRGMLMPVPFLLFSDETVEDNDATLMPIIHDIMIDARGAANENRRR
jgi:hypothetical protein